GHPVLPANRQVEGHRHGPRHRPGRQGHAPRPRLHQPGPDGHPSRQPGGTHSRDRETRRNRETRRHPRPSALAGRVLTVSPLDGRPGRWLPKGFDVIGQRGHGLDERIAWALSDARVTLPLPVVLIGMDTPQVTPELLAAAAEPLVSRTADATFGMAEDGGFWLLGLREVDPGLILGVPMSQPDTGPKQLARLEQAGLRVTMLPQLTDVDTVREAECVAAVT